MPVYVEGALIGLALGVFLVVAEYLLVKKAAKERAVRFHRKMQIEPSEQVRIRSVATFSILLPFAFGLAWWVLWG